MRVLSPKNVLNLAIVCLALLSLSGYTSEGRPNVIYILADDLGYGELGSFGQQLIKTPHLDELASRGIIFTRHYAGAPVCAPSRGSLQTGQHTGRSYIRDNFELPDSQLPLPEDEYTLGELMQDAGYITGFIGKWGLGGNDSGGQPNRQGYDFFYGYLDQKAAHNYYPKYLWRNNIRETLENELYNPHQPLRALKYLWLDDSRRRTMHREYQGKDYAPDLMLEETLAFLDRNRGRPFFLMFASSVPHLSLQVPDESLEQYLGNFDEKPYRGTFGYTPHGYPQSAYAAMISRLDSDVGSIVAHLKTLGLEEETLVVFSSDNGPTYMEQVDTELFNSTAGLRGRKASVYEGGLRVPMIASWPGHIAPGSLTDHVSAFWDIMPTLAELSGQTVPCCSDGISILPTLLGQPGQNVHDSLYWEYHDKGGQQAVLFSAAEGEPLEWKAVRIGASSDPAAPLELYNLESDPLESQNIAADYPALVRRAEAIIERKRKTSIIEEWNF